MLEDYVRKPESNLHLIRSDNSRRPKVNTYLTGNIVLHYCIKNRVSFRNNIYLGEIINFGVTHCLTTNWIKNIERLCVPRIVFVFK